MKLTWAPYRQDLHQPTDLWRRLRVAGFVLTSVLLVGTIGYVIQGLSVLDALYQTTVTVSTVGYREIGTVDTGYKIFTIGLIMVGAGAVLYTVGVLIETLLEGRLTKEFGRRRMERNIDALSNHIIVCGWGQVGQAIVATLLSEGRDVVVVDRDSEVEIGGDRLYLLGDATDDAVLAEAGLDRARSLVVALDSDAHNVYVTLSGRAMNPSLFIVARANAPEAEGKLYQAGADRVVNPHQLGGAHMAALVTHPNVVDFFDIMMTNRDLHISISEVTVPDGSVLTRLPLDECDLAGNTILGIRRPDGKFVHHPRMDAPVEPGDVLIALGTDDELSRLTTAVSR